MSNELSWWGKLIGINPKKREGTSNGIKEIVLTKEQIERYDKELASDEWKTHYEAIQNNFRFFE
jgi:hypothetical protein